MNRLRVYLIDPYEARGFVCQKCGNFKSVDEDSAHASFDEWHDSRTIFQCGQPRDIFEHDETCKGDVRVVRFL